MVFWTSRRHNFFFFSVHLGLTGQAAFPSPIPLIAWCWISLDLVPRHSPRHRARSVQLLALKAKPSGLHPSLSPPTHLTVIPCLALFISSISHSFLNFCLSFEVAYIPVLSLTPQHTHTPLTLTFCPPRPDFITAPLTAHSSIGPIHHHHAERI